MSKSPTEVLQDPNYVNANAETKQAIFDKLVAPTPDFSNANAETQNAIRQNFGLGQVVQEQPNQPNINSKYDQFLNSLRNPQTGGKSGVVGPIIVGGAGELVKGAGALTQLAFPEAGTRMVEVGRAITEGAKSVAPVAGTVGQFGSYALPFTAGQKALNVAGSIPAVKSAVGMIPSFARSATKLSTIGGVTGYALTPDDENRAESAAINATVGAALPAVGNISGKLYQGAKSLAEPFYEAGRGRILGRALRESAGGESEKAIANLRSYIPSIRGSQLTAGEVADVPSLAATQRAVMATTPEATNLAAANQKTSSQARTIALEDIATPSRLTKYADIRKDFGDDLYTPSLDKAMDFADLSKPMQAQVGTLIKSPAIKKAMIEAKENALNRGEDTLDPKGSLRGLHKTKIALDDKIDEVKAMLEKNGKTTSDELSGLNAAKTRLLGFIENVSPEYKTARETYARLSKPVEQLEAIQKLAEKTVNPKDRQIYAGRFFNQLDAIKKEGFLSDRQIIRLEAIADDLRKADFGQTAGRGVGSDTVQKLAYTNMLKQAGVPSMLQNLPAGQVVGNIIGRVGDAAYGKANRQLTSQLAEALMNPSETARLMENARNIPRKSSDLAKLLMLQPANQIIGNQNE